MVRHWFLVPAFGGSNPSSPAKHKHHRTPFWISFVWYNFDMTKFKDIDEYISAQPKDIAIRLSNIRTLFHEILPETEESIRYDLPAFTVGGYHLYMSAYKNHIGMYPMYGIPELNEKMETFRGKGTKDALHFKHGEPIPYDLIREIIIAKEDKKIH